MEYYGPVKERRKGGGKLRTVGVVAILVVLVVVAVFTYVATNRLSQEALSILSTFALAGCLGSLVIVPVVTVCILLLVRQANRANGSNGRFPKEQQNGGMPNIYVLPGPTAVGSLPQPQYPTVTMQQGAPFERRFTMVGEDYVD